MHPSFGSFFTLQDLSFPLQYADTHGSLRFLAPAGPQTDFSPNPFGSCMNTKPNAAASLLNIGG